MFGRRKLQQQKASAAKVEGKRHCQVQLWQACSPLSKLGLSSDSPQFRLKHKILWKKIPVLAISFPKDIIRFRKECSINAKFPFSAPESIDRWKNNGEISVKHPEKSENFSKSPGVQIPSAYYSAHYNNKAGPGQTHLPGSFLMFQEADVTL